MDEITKEELKELDEILDAPTVDPNEALQVEMDKIFGEDADVIECARALVSGRDCPHLFRDISPEDYDRAVQKNIME
jgi:hypothetical protein